MALGQEVELTLGAEQEPLAGDAARAERDLRLQDVVAGAERIALGIEEGEDALALVVPQKAPGDRQRAKTEADDNGELPPANADHEQDPGAGYHILQSEISGSGTPTTGTRPITMATLMKT